MPMEQRESHIHHEGFHVILEVPAIAECFPLGSLIEAGRIFNGAAPCEQN